jgi:hypothetical protein
LLFVRLGRHLGAGLEIQEAELAIDERYAVRCAAELVRLRDEADLMRDRANRVLLAPAAEALVSSPGLGELARLEQHFVELGFDLAI